MPSFPTYELIHSATHLAWFCVISSILVSSIYFIGHALYNLFLHPLRSYPGPLLWRASRLPYDYHLFTGRLNEVVFQAHKRYGETIRTAPNELSFSSSQGFKDILAHFPGKEELPKDEFSQGMPPNGIPNILLATKENHARYRRLLSHAFSEKGLRDQASHFRHYVDLLIDRLSERAGSGESTNMLAWYNMTLFDVIGDLAWGESFGCLQNRNLHEWIPAVFGSVKFAVTSGIMRRRGLDFLIPYLVDKETQAFRARNYRYSEAKVEQRLEQGEDRGDFWDRIMIKSGNDNKAGEGMSRGEMLNNASVMVLGGSETSATTLSGATYLLLRNPEKLHKLVNEVRSTFASSSDIDVFSVNRLPYTLAVIEETMRMYPPVPRQGSRKAPKGGAVICGSHIPEGTIAHTHQFAAFNSERNFHRPRSFVPERWLDDEAPPEFASDDKAAFQPFSMGTRNCIGRNLAYVEMKLIMAKVFWHFDLTLEEEKTGDWLDQKIWGLWFKKPLYVKLSEAQR